MPSSVVLGAGNIGRGFIGQLFSESGYEVIFVDVDEPLIDLLNARGSYTIRLVDNDLADEALSPGVLPTQMAPKRAG